MHTAKGSSSESSDRAKRGQQQVSFSGCLAAQTQRRKKAPGSKGPWLGFAAPHTQRLTPWVPRKCVTDVGSLALSSPAETCAGGWALTLPVWVPRFVEKCLFYSVINCALQIKLLQAKVPFHLGKTDIANLMPFLPICRVSACTYETLKIAKRD